VQNVNVAVATARRRSAPAVTRIQHHTRALYKKTTHGEESIQSPVGSLA